MMLLATLSFYLLFVNSQLFPNATRRDTVKPRIKYGSEDEAKRFIHYSMAAYCRDKDVAAWKCKPYCQGAPEKIAVRSFSNPFLNVTGYLAIDDSENQIVVSFRGSKNTQNWISNIDTLYMPILVDKKLMLVHSGFWLDTISLYPQLKAALNWAKLQRPTYKILFTGHSLGGALAGLAILRLRQDDLIQWSEIKLITYAAPRIGDASLVDYFNSKDLISLRVFNPQDIVPNLPPAPLFKHFEFPLYASPIVENGLNCGVETIMDPIRCFIQNDKLDFNHKYFWGKYYTSACT